MNTWIVGRSVDERKYLKTKKSKLFWESIVYCALMVVLVLSIYIVF